MTIPQITLLIILGLMLVGLVRDAVGIEPRPLDRKTAWIVKSTTFAVILLCLHFGKFWA